MGEHGVLGNAAGIPSRLEMRGPTAFTAAELAAFIFRHRAGLSVAAAVLALDQLSKLLVVQRPDAHGSHGLQAVLSI